MSEHPLTISPKTSIRELKEIFKKHSYWSVYVINKGRLVGIITRGDLRQRAKNLNPNVASEKIMSKEVKTIDSNEDVLIARRKLKEQKINGLAVMDNDELVGIITRYDIKTKYRSSSKLRGRGVLQISDKTKVKSTPSNNQGKVVSKLILQPRSNTNILENVKSKYENGYVPKYLGASVISKLFWCHQEFVYRSIEKEDMFKAESKRSLRLDTAGKFIDVSSSAINRYKQMGIKCATTEGKESVGFIDEDPFLKESRQHVLEQASDFQRGKFLHDYYSKQSNFVQVVLDYKGYSIIAAPDAVFDEYIHEFKSTKYNALVRYVKPCAIYQAKIYAYIFGRKNYEVVVHSLESEENYTDKGTVDNSEVEEKLDIAINLLERKMNPWPPKGWKCKICDFLTICPLGAKSVKK